jgi:hypothetical protein
MFLGKTFVSDDAYAGLCVGEVTLVFGCLNSKDKLPQRNAHFHRRNTPPIKTIKHCDRPTCNVAHPRIAQNGVKHREHGFNTRQATVATCCQELLESARHRRSLDLSASSHRYSSRAKRAQSAHAESAHHRWHRSTNNRIIRSFHH